MTTQKYVLGTIASVLLLATSSVHASPNSAASPARDCVFDKYEAAAAAPFRGEESVGYGSYTRLKGAQLYVPAQPGLTAEWLTLSVERGLAERACRPNVKDLRVNVVSAGPGFWVQLSTKGQRDAESLVRWANSVVQHQRAHVVTGAK